MDAAIAQVAAIVANGNAWLAGDLEAGARVEGGSTFQYVRAMRFERQAGGAAPATLAVDADLGSWYRRLPDWGVTALWFEPRPLAVPTAPPHILAAFTNGSRPSIVTEGAARDRWISTWSIDRAPTETDRRVWTVNSIGRPDLANLARRPGVAEATANLEKIVRAARDLATRLDWTFWARWFDGALAAAAEAQPHTTYHDDVLPPTAELDRRRLFTLAAKSYVFGGMGTWNDIGPPPEDDAANAEYDRITPALYTAILEGIAAAVNPSAVLTSPTEAANR